MAHKKGYILITIVFITATVLIVALGAVAINYANAQNVARFELGEYAYQNAEVGIEDIMLRLVRGDNSLVPNNTTITRCYPSDSANPQTTKIDISNALIATSSVSPEEYCPSITGTLANYFSIKSTGKFNSYYRTIRLCVDTNNAGIVVTHWREVAPSAFSTCTSTP
jgi:hypothetical protein